MVTEGGVVSCGSSHENIPSKVINPNRVSITILIRPPKLTHSVYILIVLDINILVIIR